MRTTRTRLAVVFVVIALGGLCLLSLWLHDPVAKIEADTPASTSTVPRPAPRASPRPAAAKEVSESPAYEKESLPFRTSVFSVTNPRELFDTHIGQAERGDPDSMLMMAHVADTCSFTGRFKNWDEWVEATPIAKSGQVPDDVQEILRATFDRLGGDCSYVNSHAPVDPDYGIGMWPADWYRKAAAAGNPIAQLTLLFGAPATEENRHAMATLLEQNIRSRDYRLYHLAAYFLAKYRPENDDAATGASWEYLACLHDTQCDAPAMHAWLDEGYSPAMVDQILETATRFDQGEVPVGSFLSSSSFDPDAVE
jgi:hypothetical protein